MASSGDLMIISIPDAIERVDKIKNQLSTSRNMRTNLKTNIDINLDNLKEYFEHLETRISGLEQENQQLRAQLQTSPIDHSVTPTSPSVPSTPAPRDSEHVVLVYPKENSQVNIAEYLSNNLDPVSLQIGIKHTRNIRNNGMLFTCPSKQTATKLEEKINSKLSQEVTARVPVKRTPRIIVYNIPISLEAEDVRDCIAHQNLDIKQYLDSLPTEDSKQNALKVCFSIRSKHQGRRHWVLAVDPTIFNTVNANNGNIYVKWESLYSSEYLFVPRCSRCSRIGHSRKACKNTEDICTKCSGKHNFKECKSSEKCCINCLKYNETKNENLNLNHSSFDINCQCYKMAQEQLRSKIAYF